MLSVPIQENVLDIEPKFGPFTARQIITIVIGLGLAVGIGVWTWFVLGIPVSSMNWLIYLVAIPTALIGFVRPYGMKFEQFFPRWLSFETEDQKVCYSSSVALMDRDEPKEILERKAMTKKASRKDSEEWLWPSCELLSPTKIVIGGPEHAIEKRR